MKAHLCALGLLAGTLAAADKIETKTTYAKAYGESKGNPTVDAAKDLPRYPAVAPKDAAATWKIKKGFKMELAASEPQVRSPIAITFDERGRLFVCEMIDYSEMRDVTPHLGRISVLEDKDGDGRYETSTVFADDLAWPTGLIWANGGLYVIATPDIWFFKDSRGGNKADIREKVFTGFGTGLKILNVQGLANCPQWGLDNRIHLQAGGGNRGVVTCLKRPDLKGVELGGKDFWFDPRTHEFGLEAGGAQFGMSFDNYGRKFACSNSDHLQYFVYDDRYAARNPYFTMPNPRQSIAADGGAAEVFRISPDEPWRIVRTRWRIAGVVKGAVEGGGRVSGYFTGATGTTVYRGDAYGDDFVNNTFTGDAGGQLVHRKKIYPDGVSLVGKRPDDEQNFEFAASNDTWVRVVNFNNAPDGCLYVMDMYREVIEHPWSIPDEIKKHLDLNSGNDRGRLWRIAPDNTNWKRRPGSATILGGKPLADLSTAELVQTLGHPNGWHRDTASRLLYEKQDKSAVPLLEKLVSESKNPLAKIHALGALGGLKALDARTITRAIADQDPHVAEVGLRLAESLGTDDPAFAEVAKAIAEQSRNDDLRLHFQIALTVGVFLKDVDLFGHPTGNGGNPAIAKLSSAVAEMVMRDFTKSEWVVDAFLSGSPDASFALAGAVFFNPGWMANAKPEVTKRIAKVIFTAASSANAAHEVERDQRGVSNAAVLVSYVSGMPKPEWVGALAGGFRKGGISLEKADVHHKLAAVFAKAGDTVRDAKAAESARLEAIQLVSLDTLKQAVPVLIVCLEKSAPDAVQTAAITALGQFSGKEVTDAVLGHWPDLQRKARTAAFAMLLARTDRATALLEAIAAKKIATGELSASDVQSLFKHKDKEVAALADKVLAELKPPSRQSMIAKFQPALSTKGDAARGQAIYTQRCLACHKAGSQGIAVGPDLITVKTKGREGILTAILDPNKEVAPQFIAYTVNTKDGQTLAGIITSDNATSMTLKMMGGAELNIPRSNIKGSSASGASLMPEGIEAGMSVQDMADLLDFIESLK